MTILTEGIVLHEMSYLIQCHSVDHEDYYKIVPFYDILTVHDTYQRSRLVDTHYDVAVQLHNGRYRMWMIQCLIGKLLAYVYHLDNFHLLIDDCVALLIPGDHTRFLHLYHARCDTAGVVGAVAIPDAVHGESSDMHMRMVAHHLDQFYLKTNVY